MKYLGLDYGITNSLLCEYDEGTVREIFNTPSAVKVAKGTIEQLGKEVWDNPQRDGYWKSDLGYIKSPRVYINVLDDSINGVTFKEMIRATLSRMLEKNIIPNSHLTLTTPINFTEKNINDIHEIVSNYLNYILDDNQVAKIHIIPEPVAAALYYTHKHLHELPNTCFFVVCDIGEEYTDLCLVELKKEQRGLCFQVIEGAQHDKIGGSDFDTAILSAFSDRLPSNLINSHKINLINYIKCSLSIVNQFNDFSVNISREEFNNSIIDPLNRLEKRMMMFKKQSNIEINNNNWYIIPTGGTCRIQAIRELLEKVFNGAYQTYQNEKNIFDSVSQGASIYSAWCAKSLMYIDYDNIKIGLQSTPKRINYDKSYIIERYLSCRDRLFTHASNDVDHNILIYELDKDVLSITYITKKTIGNSLPQIDIGGELNLTVKNLETILEEIAKDILYEEKAFKVPSNITPSKYVHTRMLPFLNIIKYKQDLYEYDPIDQMTIKNETFETYINSITKRALEACDDMFTKKLLEIDVVAFSGSTASVKYIQEAVINTIKEASKSDVIIPIYIEKSEEI